VALVKWHGLGEWEALVDEWTGKLCLTATEHGLAGVDDSSHSHR
jgi:hypothetical protein